MTMPLISAGVQRAHETPTMVVPSTHSKSDIQDGPLPELRGKIVLLVRVGNQCIVGRHHGHVEMEEISEEGRFVRSWISGRHYSMH